MENKWILLYDGSCGFCNFWVKWILNHDHSKTFLFASLQSEFGQEFLRSRHLSLTEFDTLYIVNEKGEYKSKLDAVMEICRRIGGVYRLASLGKLLPKFMADKIYDIVAQNRKKLMGENCYLPTPEERKRFIS